LVAVIVAGLEAASHFIKNESHSREEEEKEEKELTKTTTSVVQAAVDSSGNQYQHVICPSHHSILLFCRLSLTAEALSPPVCGLP
jgi:hypothetical protein